MINPPLTLKIGLTGSIGMGKSTVAKMFAELGVPVWDADEAVHRLYATSQTLKDKLRETFGDILTGNVIDRSKLSDILKADSSKYADLDAIVHPMVRKDRAAFMVQHKDEAMVVADIPLLYETKSEKTLDYVVVVTAPAEVQKQRVMARAGMTEEKFKAIINRQVSDQDKRQRADFIIHTDQPLENTRADVVALHKKLLNRDLDKTGDARP